MIAPFTIPIPTYQCHKRVQALRIKAVVPNPRGYELHFEDERFCPVEVSSAWVEHRGAGVVGGYAVWYGDDGYLSWSPAAAFEAGYTLLEDGSDFLGRYATGDDVQLTECPAPVGLATQAARDVNEPTGWKRGLVRLRYADHIRSLFESMFEPWMDDADKDDLVRELLALTGVTLKGMDDEIQAGVDNGYSPEHQMEMARALLGAREVGK